MAFTGNYAKRITADAAICMAGVLEYLTAEILELSGDACAQNNRARIIPRHISMAVRKDNEMDVLLKDVTIASGGVLGNINAALLPKPTKAKKAARDVNSNVDSQDY